MLGDTIDKTKNPLKKAMKRRTDKRVTFTAPTFVEPSDYEFSSEEEMGDDISPPTGGSRSGEDQNAEDADQDEITSVAPLNIKQGKRDGSPEKNTSSEEDRRRTITDDLRSSDELFDSECKSSEARQYKHTLIITSVDGKKQSRNGTVRNTDSFFRDESIETRKITLTPNILRDDSSSITSRPSNDRGPSFELIEKELRGDSKLVKAEKPKKEKKPGLLGGLFSRKKEKKSKDGDKNGKVSGEMSRESPSMDLDEARSSPIEKPVVEKQTRQEIDLGRTGSKNKLQKLPPNSLEPAGTSSPDGVRQAEPTVQTKHSAEPMSKTASLLNPARVVSPIAEVPEEHRRDTPSEPVSKVGILTNITNKLHSPIDGAKPEKVKRAKRREALDVDSTPEEEQMDPFGDQAEASELLVPPPGLQKPGAMSSTERLSESPVHITAADATPPETEPPPLMGDSSSTSSADELASLRSSPSPPLVKSAGTDATSRDMASSPTLSPESHSPTHGENLGFPAVVNRHVQPESHLPPPPTRSPPPQPSGTRSPVPPMNMGPQTVSTPARNNSTSTVASTLSPTTSNIPQWSDAHLRAYLDDPSDIRDLLLVVHDTSGVVPVGPDHPLMSKLFAEERGKVQEMNTALDSLLGQWLAKKRAPNGINAGRKPSDIKKPSITNVEAGL